MKKMKKVRKGKKILIVILIAIIVIVAAAIIITKIVKKNTEKPTTPVEEQQVIQLPETTYSDMEVKNIHMEYLKDNNETMITMSIYNTTSSKVEDENLNAILIGPDDNVLGQLPTYIDKLDANEQYDISVIFKGDLTSTKQIKLEKK